MINDAALLALVPALLGKHGKYIAIRNFVRRAAGVPIRIQAEQGRNACCIADLD